MQKKISCIIPFYNEGQRIFPVLEAICNLPAINEIICVDDGSQDNIANLIKAKYSEINVIRLLRNQGKSTAVGYGLKAVSNEFVLLMDADLQGINIAEIENAINGIQENSEIDMIIFRRINASWYIKLNRGDILFSGERIIRKEELQEVLKGSVYGYQLELAINKYMQENNKTVVWMPGSWTNTYKVQKLGAFTGLLKEMIMYSNLLIRFGAGTFIRQIMHFANHTLEKKDTGSTNFPLPYLKKQKMN